MWSRPSPEIGGLALPDSGGARHEGSRRPTEGAPQSPVGVHEEVGVAEIDPVQDSPIGPGNALSLIPTSIPFRDTPFAALQLSLPAAWVCPPMASALSQLDFRVDRGELAAGVVDL